MELLKSNLNFKKASSEKILLMLLPFWTPLMPPLGIASIKSFLQSYGYSVKTYDANVNSDLWEINHKYFSTLRGFVLEQNRGNFYNIGYNVLRNHLMVYINRRNEDEHADLIQFIVEKHFYCRLDRAQLYELDMILKLFYDRLEKYLIDTIETERPTIFGLSVFSGTFAPSVFAFRLVKEKYPHIKTVMGGGIFSDQLPLGSPDLEFFVQRSPFVDKIMIGEGRILWLKYLMGKLPETQRLYSMNDISEEKLEFSSIPLEDLTDFELQYYPYMGGVGSSSCPYQCSFCNVAAFWGKYKKKDPKQTVMEMIEIYNKHKCQLFFMTDSLLNPIINELSEEFTKAGVSLYWDGYLRVDKKSCDIQSVMKWRRAGFYRARLGVESGSQKVLDLIGKNITIQDIKNVISVLALAGIKVTAYIVIGHPEESEEDFQKTLDLVEELKDDLWEVECNPFGFYYSGQSKSDEWKLKRELLYPKEARDVLISQTWLLDCYPSREETYQRVFRFAEHCNKLGIPNPYSMQDLYNADERWKRLHKNAVPSVMEFKNNNGYINENLRVGTINTAKVAQEFSEDFSF